MIDALPVGRMIPDMPIGTMKRCADCNAAYRARANSKYCMNCRVDRMGVWKEPKARRQAKSSSGERCIHGSYDPTDCLRCRRREASR